MPPLYPSPSYLQATLHTPLLALTPFTELFLCLCESSREWWREAGVSSLRCLRINVERKLLTYTYSSLKDRLRGALISVPAPLQYADMLKHTQVLTDV